MVFWQNVYPRPYGGPQERIPSTYRCTFTYVNRRPFLIRSPPCDSAWRPSPLVAVPRVVPGPASTSALGSSASLLAPFSHAAPPSLLAPSSHAAPSSPPSPQLATPSTPSSAPFPACGAAPRGRSSSQQGPSASPTPSTKTRTTSTPGRRRNKSN